MPKTGEILVADINFMKYFNYRVEVKQKPLHPFHIVHRLVHNCAGRKSISRCEPLLQKAIHMVGPLLTAQEITYLVVCLEWN